mgnify:CR=1 FL=1
MCALFFVVDEIEVLDVFENQQANYSEERNVLTHVLRPRARGPGSAAVVEGAR